MSHIICCFELRIHWQSAYIELIDLCVLLSKKFFSANVSYLFFAQISIQDNRTLLFYNQYTIPYVVNFVFCNKTSHSLEEHSHFCPAILISCSYPCLIKPSKGEFTWKLANRAPNRLMTEPSVLSTHPWGWHPWDAFSEGWRHCSPFCLGAEDF